ncbi:MAG: hypothetical protein UV60_C0006G0082 [Parcubacteria group bacterium GW2011_GWA2_43_11]|nr:MAG: hypothetical protein UU89_C0002G0015 [Parcubacteria group bacterium GW2011_GWC2_42_11]KKS85730.1 MAG: hypothetical protein UV60_C0006G0082 [Parcubacteria group bacterium GW2011_GWA2_43_11]
MRFLLPIVGIILPNILFAQATLFNIIFEAREVFVVLVQVGLAVALVVFVWGLMVFIANADNEKERDEGKSRMVWGIVALFMIVSVWGVVALLSDLMGVSGADTTQPAPIIEY